MAARRLIIAMVVLLSVSTGIAILAPSRNTGTNDDTTASTGTTATTGVSGASGASGASGDPAATGDTGTNGATGGTGASGPAADSSQQSVELPTGSKVVTAQIQEKGRLESVDVAAGDRLILSVRTEKPGDVQIDGLGLTSTSTEYEPARFDILVPPGNGTYEVISVSTQEVIGQVIAGKGDQSKAGESA